MIDDGQPARICHRDLGGRRAVSALKFGTRPHSTGAGQAMRVLLYVSSATSAPLASFPCLSSGGHPEESTRCRCRF